MLTPKQHFKLIREPSSLEKLSEEEFVQKLTKLDQALDYVVTLTADLEMVNLSTMLWMLSCVQLMPKKLEELYAVWEDQFFKPNLNKALVSGKITGEKAAFLKELMALDPSEVTQEHVAKM